MSRFEDDDEEFVEREVSAALIVGAAILGSRTFESESRQVT